MVFHITKRGICRPCMGSGFVRGLGMMKKKCPNCLCEHCNGTGLNQKVLDIPEMKGDKCVACFGKGATGMERTQKEGTVNESLTVGVTTLEHIPTKHTVGVTTLIKRRGRPKRSSDNQVNNNENFQNNNDLTDLTPQL